MVNAAAPVVAGQESSRLDVEPLEETVDDWTEKGRDGKGTEGGRSSEGVHEEPAEEAPGALADAEEERAHEPHDAGDRVGRRDLGDVGDGWSHHQGHGQAFEGLERVNVGWIGYEGVAEKPGDKVIKLFTAVIYELSY